jgi:hypothetical protein
VLALSCDIPPPQSVLSENEANNVPDRRMSASRNKVIHTYSKQTKRCFLLHCKYFSPLLILVSICWGIIPFILTLGLLSCTTILGNGLNILSDLSNGLDILSNGNVNVDILSDVLREVLGDGDILSGGDILIESFGKFGRMRRDHQRV